MPRFVRTQWVPALAVSALAATGVQAESVSIGESLVDNRRALIVEAIIRDGAPAESLGAFVSEGPPRGLLADPADILIDWFDIDGGLIGTRGTWDPRQVFSQDEQGVESTTWLPEAEGVFAMPLSPDIARVQLRDGETTEVLLNVGVVDVITDFCGANPLAPACDGHVPNAAPTADAGGPYAVYAGERVQLDGSASADPDGNPLTYRWDLDGDGVFGETDEGDNGAETGVQPYFNAATDGAPYTVTVGLEVCDGALACAQDTAQVSVDNRPVPTRPGDFNGDGFVDWNDIGWYLAPGQLNRPAETDDPMDLNGDGVVNIIDARIGLFFCDLPRCAIAP